MSKVVDSDNMRYTRDHSWIMLEDDVVTVGITDYAQNSLPDINLVEMPAEGLEVSVGDEVASLESLADSLMVVASVDGTVMEVNQLLDKNPQLINADPYGDGWIFRLEVLDVSPWQDLMTAEEYSRFID
ncbi:MAG: glycine cleavage system protein GcvH [Planctomycetota bacterium]|jgi:glycine cleavage system H protein|nr:glycine cleavage system protein GcvH [Planctomycetota bacterium]